MRSSQDKVTVCAPPADEADLAATPEHRQVSIE